LAENQQLHAKINKYNQNYAYLEDGMKHVKEQLVTVLQQRDDASTDTSQFHHQYAPKHDD